MGRRSHSGGVRAVGSHGIEFTFWLHGQRYRPTVSCVPNELNLRRARKELAAIKERIANHTFALHDEFPDYRFKPRGESGDALPTATPSAITCDQMFDAFLAHCQMRVEMKDLAYSTLTSYRGILDYVWRPKIGPLLIEQVRYSGLAAVAAEHTKNKKTYNNVVSTVRCAFELQFRDYPERHNPALGLKTLRIRKRDCAPIEPFTLEEGERIIARSHREFGPVHGNYEEWRFFTGVRPSEAMALQVSDVDLTQNKVCISKAYVRGRLEDRTKTHEEREIELCPRANQVLVRQLAIRDTLVRAGRIRHAFVFFQRDGRQLRNLSYAYDRWRYVVTALGIPYRAPYNARHSWVSWSIMAGRNVLLLAQADGHSVETMLRRYTAWTKGTREAEVELIKRAMARSPKPHYTAALANVLATEPHFPPNGTTHAWGRLSWRKYKQAR